MNLLDIPLERRPTTWDRIRNSIAVVLLSFIALSIGVAVWSLFKEPDLTYQDIPWPVAGEERTFRAGSTVPIMVTRCNRLKEPIIYEVTRGLKNIETGVTQVLNSTRVSAEPGCKKSVSMLHKLPDDLKPGTYVVTGIGTIPDMLNTKRVPFSSQPFAVE